MGSRSIDLVLRHLRRLAAVPMTDHLSDRQLLDRFITGREQDAFTVLVQRYGSMVFGVCQRVLKKTHDAEDAFQATFLVLARKAASIRKGESVGSWLHGVAHRVAQKAGIEAIRRSRRERQRPALPTGHAVDDLTWGELKAALDEELDRLPSSCRAPLVICYLEGQTQDEAAWRLGWSKSTVRRRLERGRRLLRSRLTRRGVTLSAALVAPFLGETGTAAPLPSALTAATVAAGLRFAASQPIGTEMIATHVVALVDGILKSMALAKDKWATVVLLAISLVTGASLCAYQAVFQKKEASTGTSAIVAPGGKQAEPQPAERTRVDQFGDPLPIDALARLGTIRFRHGANILSVAFAADGKTLASAGHDGAVHVWETATGTELVRIVDDRLGLQGGSVEAVAYSPDGKNLAGARVNRRPCLWDVSTGREIRQFGDENYRAEWIVFSPDGKTLAYGGQQFGLNGPVPEKIIRLADPATGKELRQLVGHQGEVTCIAFSPDGKTLASCGEDETIRLWHVGTGRELLRFDGQPKHVNSLVFAPDGKTLAARSDSDKLIRLIDAGTGKELRIIPLAGPRDAVRRGKVLFTPDGRTLISSHASGLVRFWDVASGTRTREFQADRSAGEILVLSPDGKVLATDGDSLYTGEHVVRLWETATGNPLVRHDGPQQGIADVVFSPDNQCVATTSCEGAVYVWESATGRRLQHFDSGDRPTYGDELGHLAFTPDGKALLLGGWKHGVIQLWDLATAKQIRRFPAHPEGIQCLGLGADGKTLVTAGKDHIIRLWDLATGRPIHDFGKQKGPTHRIALSRDAKLLASTHHIDHPDDYEICLWEVATGKLLWRRSEKHLIRSIAFSPDGTMLAIGSDGKMLIRLWEVATDKEIRHLRRELDQPFGSAAMDVLAFSPNGKTLISGGQCSKDVFLWEVATARLRGQLKGHQGHLTCVAFSPDGTMMASGSTDASALIWDATGRRARPPVVLTTAQLEDLWIDLGANDAATAYQAMCRLTASPRQAVALLAKHVKPLPHADAQRLAESLRNLGSDQFAVRDKATQELQELGEAAELALRQVLANRPTLEVRRRVEQLLERLDETQRLRRSRAVEVLEHIDGSESRQLLSALAQGASQASLTREAKAALRRMTH